MQLSVPLYGSSLNVRFTGKARVAGCGPVDLLRRKNGCACVTTCRDVAALQNTGLRFRAMKTPIDLCPDRSRAPVGRAWPQVETKKFSRSVGFGTQRVLPSRRHEGVTLHDASFYLRSGPMEFFEKSWPDLFDGLSCLGLGWGTRADDGRKDHGEHLKLRFAVKPGEILTQVPDRRTRETLDGGLQGNAVILLLKQHVDSPSLLEVVKAFRLLLVSYFEPLFFGLDAFALQPRSHGLKQTLGDATHERQRFERTHYLNCFVTHHHA